MIAHPMPPTEPVTAEQVTTVLYVVVSLISLATQVTVLRGMRAAAGVLRRPLLRTSIARVFCAVLYVIVGVNGLITHWHTLTFTFLVFCVVQATWQINARLDMKLARRNARLKQAPYQPRHLSPPGKERAAA